MVRRAAILCLVAIGNVVGMQELGPVLSPSTVCNNKIIVITYSFFQLKLVEVYRDRLAQKGKVSL